MIKVSKARITFEVFNIFFLTLIAFVTVLPFIYVIASSFSGLVPLARNEVFLYPKEFTVEAYVNIFVDGTILRTYYNTIWYTGVGVIISVFLTMGAAYPLSRRNYTLRSWLMIFVTVTMFFSGGLIPSYILVRQIGLYNTRWAMVIPGAVSAFNLVMARVFLQSNIPEDMTEAARIDGASDVMVFFRIVLPLSKAIIAVLALYYGVGIWNTYFQPLIYLPDPKLEPLALYLRRLLVASEANMAGNSEAVIPGFGAGDPLLQLAFTRRLRFAAVVVAMVPIMMVYPLLQKYFTQGVMIGAFKE
jgi:putative aldouronate transport system permease protein